MSGMLEIQTMFWQTYHAHTPTSDDSESLSFVNSRRNYSNTGRREPMYQVRNRGKHTYYSHKNKIIIERWVKKRRLFADFVGKVDLHTLGPQIIETGMKRATLFVRSCVVALHAVSKNAHAAWRRMAHTTNVSKTILLEIVPYSGTDGPPTRLATLDPS